MADGYDITRPEQATETFAKAGEGRADEGTGPARGLYLKRGEAKILKDRLRRSIAYYEKRFKDPADRCLRMWRGDHWNLGDFPNMQPDQHALVVNYIKHIIQTKNDATCFNPAEIVVKPLNREGERNAPTARIASNYEYKEANAHREAKRTHFDKELFGFGVLMTGWEFWTDDIYLVDGRQTVEGEEPEAEALNRAVEEGKPLPAPVARDKVRRDNFYSRRLDPRRFLVSPEGDWVLQNHEYCGYREIVPLDEVKALGKAGKFENTASLKGSMKNLDEFCDGLYPKNQSGFEPPSDVKRVELWHYFEKKRRIHCIFAEESEKPLLVEEWPWPHDRYPFHCLFGPRTQDDFYPDRPQVLDWEHMQREINLHRSLQATHAGSNAQFFTVAEGSIDEANKQILSSTTPNRVVTVKTQSAQGAIAAGPQTQINPDAHQAVRQAEDDLATLSLLGDYALGNVSTKRMTTTEVEAIQGQGGARKQAEVRDFEEFCAGIARDLLDWLQQFAVRTRLLPIYADDDPMRVQEWIEYDATLIKGDYDLEVYVGSTEVKNTQGRVEEIGFVLQALQPYVQMGAVNPTELVKQFLGLFPDIKNLDAIVPQQGSQPGAPPAAAAMGMGEAGEGGPPGPVQGLPPGLPPELLAQLG